MRTIRVLSLASLCACTAYAQPLAYKQAALVNTGLERSTTMAKGDFNGDGRLDIVVGGTANNTAGGAPNRLAVLLGNGNGSFTVGPPVPYLPGVPVLALAVADMNRDGRLDLVVGGGNYSILIYFGLGNGEFINPTTYTASVGGDITRILVIDLNGDSRPDIVTQEYETVDSMEMHVLLQSANGTFTFAEPMVFNGKGWGLAAADFNKDGKTDLVAANVSSFRVLLGNGNGTFQEAPGSPYVPPSPGAYGVVTGDFNQDGNMDFFGGYSLNLYWGNGAGGFTRKFFPPVSNFGDYLQAADLDGDNKIDFVGLQSGPNLITGWRTDGQGEYLDWTHTPMSTPFSQPMDFTVGELNNDGRLELIVLGLTGQVGVFKNTFNRIDFPAIAARVFGSTPFASNATASSGLPVTLQSQTPSTCSVSGTSIRMLTTGLCIIVARQSGNSEFPAAEEVTRSFQIMPVSQTIQVSAVATKFVDDPPFPITATATSGLPVTLSAQAPSSCTVTGNIVTVAAFGPCTIVATQPGNAIYLAAQPVLVFFQIVKRTQSINFPSISSRTLDSGPFAVSAVATSGLPVTMQSQTLDSCTVNGSVVTLVAVGNCVIVAKQGGNEVYSSAPDVTQSFQITLRPQSIQFPAISGKTFGNAPFTVAPQATSGLTVTVASDTPSICTVTSNVVTIVNAGTCILRATQSGNSTYAAATPVLQSFAIQRASQTITFATIPARQVGDPPVALSAMASSGLPVSYAVLSGPGTVQSSSLTVTAEGTVVVQASQAGSSNYTAATPVTQSVTVMAAPTSPRITGAYNAASYSPSLLAPASYATLFGKRFPNQPSVTLRDATGQLLTASITYAGPEQINVFLPATIAAGAASVRVESANESSDPFPVTIASLSPGLFTVDAAGTVPAAQVVLVSSDGTQEYRDPFSCGGDPTVCTLAPIPIPSGGQAILVLYGTGIRGRSPQGQVVAEAGGVLFPVLYAGAQGGFPGLDQINLRIPDTLAGRGVVTLRLTVDGIQANPIQIQIQ